MLTIKQHLKQLYANIEHHLHRLGAWLDSGRKTTVIFITPYVVMFSIFIVIPVFFAILLSFTHFNGIQFPTFAGLRNYIFILTQDEIFMRTVLPNTLIFSIFVGPGGYLLSFFLAWMLSQIPRLPRNILALIIYSPSMTAGIAIAVVWRIIFSGDEAGLLNGMLLSASLINEPVQWLQSPEFLMPIMIIVALWSSMGIGFLAVLAGLLNVNRELYEAAYIDGIRNRFQEIVYITIPSIKKQMMFSAVMSIVGTIAAGGIGVTLSGANPTPQNAGQLIINHIEDFGILRSELGMAAAMSVVLLLLMMSFTKLFSYVFSSEE